VKRLLAISVVLCWAGPALGWPSLFTPQPSQPPHPAVVRVIAQDRDGFSMGSGALVAVDASHGLVVTNWHVVRDAVGPVAVEFPDGFRSGAVVLRTDRDWDLAALAIWKPAVQPIPLATQPPQPGQWLWIAGYGSGSYRAVAGRCTEYLSPGRNLPNEMVELEAGARLGDSGGPILNCQGELAGVLFGTGFGKTMGSYCGRVRVFLVSVGDEFQRLPTSPTMVAQAPPPYRGPPPSAITAGPAAAGNVPAMSSPPGDRPQPAAAATAGSSPAEGVAVSPRAWSPTTPPPVTCQSNPSVAASCPPDAAPQPQPPLPSHLEQIKTILAAIGILALLFHGIRLVGAAAG
jgi:S1-C subfamily serine protease